MIRTLIVDDSATAQEFLLRALEGQEDIEVVGLAANGREAVEMASRLRPTLITMDIRMPEMDGLMATEQIMTDCPTRIVIISSGVGSELAKADQTLTFEALQAGALEVFPKVLTTDGMDRYRARLLSTVRAMASVSVLRRRRGTAGVYFRPVTDDGSGAVRPVTDDSLGKRPVTDEGPGTVGFTGISALQPSGPQPSRTSIPPLGFSAISRKSPQAGWRKANATRRVLAIGASTGGPPVLAQLLAALPAEVAFPIAVVQHMAPGFTDGFARWLQDQTRLRVKLAEDGEEATPGSVYLAPEGVHLRLGSGSCLRVSPNAQESQFCPSVDVLFQSVATVAGRTGIGLLLTGMGDDGARGMLALHQAGGLALAQEGDSCVVNGMPAAAAELGAVDRFVRPSLMPGCC